MAFVQCGTKLLESYKNLAGKHVINYATSHNRLSELFPKYIQNWIKERRELPTTLHIIYPESQRGTVSWHPDQYQREHVRYIPDEFLTIGEITCTGTKTMLFSFEQHEEHAVVIDSQDIANTIQRMLKFMWHFAKE